VEQDSTSLYVGKEIRQ
jgi:hypothetical protein